MATHFDHPRRVGWCGPRGPLSCRVALFAFFPGEVWTRTNEFSLHFLPADLTNDIFTPDFCGVRVLSIASELRCMQQSIRNSFCHRLALSRNPAESKPNSRFRPPAFDSTAIPEVARGAQPPVLDTAGSPRLVLQREEKSGEVRTGFPTWDSRLGLVLHRDLWKPLNATLLPQRGPALHRASLSTCFRDRHWRSDGGVLRCCDHLAYPRAN